MKTPVLSFKSGDTTHTIWVLRKGQFMQDCYHCERGFEGPSIVLRIEGPFGSTSRELDIDDLTFWEWIGGFMLRDGIVNKDGKATLKIGDEDKFINQEGYIK